MSFGKFAPLNGVLQARELSMLTYHQSVRLQVDNVLVQYHIFDTDEPLMVTFPPSSNAMSQEQVDADQQAWSFQFFAKKKMNVISFNHIGGETHYFDSAKFAAFIDDLSDSLFPFPARIGYGCSKGGFAAAFHAKALKLDKALLLMPLSTYWQPNAPWDPKLSKHTELQVQDMSHIDASHCETPLTIIYDPLFIPDTLHKKRFKSCVASYRIPGVGHRIARALQHTGSLKETILEFREGEINAERFYRVARKRKQLSYYFRSIDKSSTQKMTPKRLGVIYLHRFYQYKSQSIDLDKLKSRLQQSIEKRVNSLCGLVQGKSIIAVRNFAGGTAFMFC